MTQLEELLKPTWSAEKSLKKAWSVLNQEEKLNVENRIDKVFYNDVPFQLEHSTILYVHLFSLFAQLEIIGLRGLIKSLEKLTKTPLYQQMRQQIVDEVFHAILFAKLAFQLSAPYALPLNHHKVINQFISPIEDESDLATALTLVNLVGEGWVGELCSAMIENKIAVPVFEMVLEDESRHVDEYDLYQQIGLPDKDYLSKKLGILENELISTVFSQEQYVNALVLLLGRDGALKLLSNINKKQHEMLERLSLTPSKNWQFFMHTMPLLMNNIMYPYEEDQTVELTNTRKVLSALWNDPELPTQSSVFHVNVTPVCFFEKKFPPETVTCLMLQALSKACFDNPQLRNYMFHHKLYHPNDCYVALAVQLPGCGEQLGTIEFKNCHEMSTLELAQHIKHDLSMMTYCYKKIQSLQMEHPYLRDKMDKILTPRNERIYRDPFFISPSICLSNIGHWGYKTAVSPLFPNETVKFTLTEIDRKHVWNKTNNQFEVQDILPVGISIDHRVFDGNVPVPHYMQTAFDAVFMNMEQSTIKSGSQSCNTPDTFINYIDRLLENDLEFGFIYLFALTNVWKNYTSHEELRKNTEDNYRSRTPV